MDWIHAVASFLLSALSGMGVGGGGLFVIYLGWVTDTPQLAAQGMNLMFFLCSAGTAVLVHLRKRKIFLWAVVIMAASGVVGALIGTALAQQINEDILRKTFGVMLVISGILSLKHKEKQDA